MEATLRFGAVLLPSSSLCITPPPGGRFEDSRSYSWLSRVGGSATTPVEDTESTTNGEVDLEEITEWSVQLNLNFWRDHTVYSREFVEKWRQDVVPAIERRLLAANKSIREVVDEAGFGTPEDRAAVIAALRSAVDVRVTDTGHLTGVDAAYLKELYEGIAGAAGPEDAIDRLSRDSVARKMYEAVDSEIERRVREPIRNGRSVPESTRTSLHDLRSTLTSSHASMTQIKKDLEEKLQDVMRVPILTAEYTNHKALQGSSVSDAKLLFQYKVDPRAFGLPEPFDIITNGNVSFYNDPDRSMGQHTLRDYGIGVGAEFSFDNPFAKFLSDADASNIGLSFSGRVARLESAEDEVGFAQAKLEIPITAAFRIPLSVTYASRTEEIDESEVRGNIGFTVDFDQLYALAGLALAQRH